MTASQIFAFDAYQAEDALEKELERDFQALNEIVGEKSEVEITGTLLNQASQGGPKQSRIINGLMFAVLTKQRIDAESSLKYLSVCARDNYGTAISVLKYLTGTPFQQLQEYSRRQIIWLVGEFIKRKVKSTDAIILNLMKNIQGGDIGPLNLFLIQSTLELLQVHKEWVMQFHGLISTSTYTFLRILIEHGSFPDLQQAEIAYCKEMLTNKFPECQVIGRELVRALWEASQIPAIKQLFGQFMDDSACQSIKGFPGIKQVLQSPTPRHFLQSRLLPEMEANLLFILEKVEWGKNDDMYVDWFGQLYFQQQAQQTPDALISDIIRYIVAAFYPPNELIQSKVIPRFALIGKLLKAAKNKSISPSLKFALFFDWICFCGSRETVMNVEPGILLMDRSVERYSAITQWCLVYLNQLVNSFYPPLSRFFQSNVTEAVRLILTKGVLRSMDHLYHCQTLDQSSKLIIWDLFYQPASRINTVHDKVDPGEAMSSEDGYPLTITEAATEPSLTSKEGEEVPEITVAELAEMESGELASSDEEISIAKEHQLPPSSNDENLWMFGDLLTRLSDSLMDPSAVEQLLAKIIDVCFKMSVPLDALAAQLIYLLPAQPVNSDDLQSNLSGWHIIFDSYRVNIETENAHILRTLLLELIHRDTSNIICRRMLLYCARKNDFTEYLDLLERRSGNQETLVLSDMTAIEAEDVELFFYVIIRMLSEIPELTTGKLPIIKTIVASIDPQQLYTIIYEITSKRIRMIGDQITIEIILETFEWDSFEQQNFWAIASSESLIHISLQQTFCRVFVELFKTWQSSDHPEASLGILNLLRSDPIFAGSEPLVGALLSQPAFAESPFMIAVLNTWACVPGLPTVLDKSINKVIKSGDPTILTNLDKWKAQRRK